jgi:hypothetical protein
MPDDAQMFDASRKTVFSSDVFKHPESHKIANMIL